MKHYGGTGGDTNPLLPVVTLPTGVAIDSPRAKADLARLDGRLGRALPGARIASYASTGNRAFVSKDGRTTFAIIYPPPDPSSTFGDNPKAEKAARGALRGQTVAGQPVHLTGFEALQHQTGGGDGPGVLLEALLGGAGALLVLTFVFASFLAVVPILTAAVSIMTTFLLLLGLTKFTDVSPIVQFLIALVGLGVAIDYSLIVVSRWREERAHGRSDDAVQRAMETSGRAVVFSGITVAIGLLALIALPLPFLRSMGYGGMLIPLVSTIVAVTLLPVILAKWGHRLDWPHRRTDDKASRAWTRWAEAVSRRRWIAAGTGLAVIVALAFGHRPPARRRRRQHHRQVGRRQAGARRAGALRHRRGLDLAQRDPRRRRREPRPRGRRPAEGRGHPRRGRPAWLRLAPRRHGARGGDPRPRQRQRRRREDADRGPRHRPRRPPTTADRPRGQMTTQSRLAIEATGLVKSFGETRAVDGVDLAVRRGSV
jgi:MMPL family protein